MTHLIDYDGELILVPNHDVFTNPLANLTRRRKRPTRVVVGVDYDDDHNQAREVIRRAVEGVDGVSDDPAVQVVLTDFGDSSVNFEARYGHSFRWPPWSPCATACCPTSRPRSTTPASRSPGRCARWCSVLPVTIERGNGQY